MDLLSAETTAESLLSKLEGFSRQLTPDEAELLKALFALAELNGRDSHELNIDGPIDINHSQLYTINQASSTPPLIDEGLLSRLPSLLSSSSPTPT